MTNVDEWEKDGWKIPIAQMWERRKEIVGQSGLRLGNREKKNLAAGDLLSAELFSGARSCGYSTALSAGISRHSARASEFIDLLSSLLPGRQAHASPHERQSIGIATGKDPVCDLPPSIRVFDSTLHTQPSKLASTAPPLATRLQGTPDTMPTPESAAFLAKKPTVPPTFDGVDYDDNKRLKQAQDAIIREQWVQVMMGRLVREELNKCYYREGVNHLEKCGRLRGQSNGTPASLSGRRI